jgi:lipopolysaccharide biosynthesis regulator YciM
VRAQEVMVLPLTVKLRALGDAETTGAGGKAGVARAVPELLPREPIRTMVTKGDYRCATCGYGVSVHRSLPRCPMCGGNAWLDAARGDSSRTLV